MKIEISQTIEDALRKGEQKRPDAVGSLYHTFRLDTAATKLTAGEAVSRLVAAGWHLVGGPMQIDAIADAPEHLLVTMLRHEPRPMQIRIGGEFRGEVRPD